tara:strand:+ start:1049 stop:1927 length:879 start_codon:yes stop_codon:yes gene_type:complete
MTKFDVIVGNPPYQGAKSTGTKGGKPPTIWPKFVETCNQQLADDGVMVLVHPAMYRKPGNELQNILFTNCVQLHMYNNAEAIETFGANTRYDWYVIDKTYQGTTKVYFEDLTTMDVDLKPGVFMPNGSWHAWQQVMAAGDHLQVTKKTDTSNDVGNFDIIHTITKTKGMVVRKSSNKPKSYGVRKVILSETGCEAFYDKEGTFGTSCNCYYVKVDTDDQGESLVRFVNSDLCDHLTQSVKWSNFRTEYCLWTYIACPWLLGIDSNSTEEDINKAYGISATDIAFIYGQNRNK